MMELKSAVNMGWALLQFYVNMSINHVHVGLIVGISAQRHLDGSFAHYMVPQRLIII